MKFIQQTPVPREMIMIKFKQKSTIKTSSSKENQKSMIKGDINVECFTTVSFRGSIQALFQVRLCKNLTPTPA